MGRFYVLSSTILFVAVAILFWASSPISAYNLYYCPNNIAASVESHSVNFDLIHGNFPLWWQSEILLASGTWNDPSVNADFTFVADSTSNNDWTKMTNNYITNQAITSFTLLFGNIDGDRYCWVSASDTYFNTRYSFDDCYDCDEDTFDVKTIALHEFGHRLILNHVSYFAPWDHDCAMWLTHGTDRTLCDVDIDGIQAIYGAVSVGANYGSD